MQGKEAELSPHLHYVHFFEPAQFPAAEIANFLYRGLRQGEAAILMASPAHASLIEEEASKLRLNVRDLRNTGLWSVTEVEGMLLNFEAGIPTATIVEQFIAETVRPAQARVPSKRIRIYGELEAAILSRLGNAEISLEIERYGNRLVEEGVAKIYCGYSTDAFPDASFAKPFMKVCQLHDRVHNGLTDRDDWRYQMADKMAIP
jgi:MEDS: MEthanogen/methylotroph, DcmR Sensory domain